MTSQVLTPDAKIVVAINAHLAGLSKHPRGVRVFTKYNHAVYIIGNTIYDPNDCIDWGWQPGVHYATTSRGKPRPNRPPPFNQKKDATFNRPLMRRTTQLNNIGNGVCLAISRAIEHASKTMQQKDLDSYLTTVDTNTLVLTHCKEFRQDRSTRVKRH